MNSTYDSRDGSNNTNKKNGNERKRDCKVKKQNPFEAE